MRRCSLQVMRGIGSIPARGCAGLSLAVFFAAPVLAQQVELTPFIGYQFGGTVEEEFDNDDDFDFFDDVDVEASESFGAILSFGMTPSASLELLYSTQESNLEESGLFGADLAEIDIEYFHVGFQWQWAARNKLRPFAVISAGGTRFSLEQDDDTRLSASLGGGFKVFFSDHVGLRFEGRLYSTFIDEEDEIDCGRRRCYRYDDEAVFLQLDAKLGLILAF